MPAFNVLVGFAMVALSGVAVAAPVGVDKSVGNKSDVSTPGSLLFGQRSAPGNIPRGRITDAPSDDLQGLPTATPVDIGGHIKGNEDDVDAPKEGIGGGSSYLPATDTTPLGDYDDDYAADISTEAMVTVGGDFAAGNIGSVGDQDWFAVYLHAGRTYRIDMGGYDNHNGLGVLEEPVVPATYNASGGYVFGAFGNFRENGHSHLLHKPEATGIYYIVASSYSAEGVGGYRILVKDITDILPIGDDYADGVLTTGEVVVGGGFVVGNIESFGDEDWFKVDLQAGVTYLIDLEAFDNGNALGSVLPRWRGVYDASGNHVSHRWSYTPETSGDWYVVVASIWDRGVGSYRISVTGQTDDYSADVSTTGEVVVDGDFVEGTIEEDGDHDWFAVELRAGHRYLVEMLGHIRGRTISLYQPILGGMYDGSGNHISGRTANYYDTDKRRIYVPGSSGVWYIDAGASEATGRADEYRGNYQGGYRLSVKDITDK